MGPGLCSVSTGSHSKILVTFDLRHWRLFYWPINYLMLRWGNNRQQTDQSNSHQFSELLEYVLVDLGLVKKIIWVRSIYIGWKPWIFQSQSFYKINLSCLDHEIIAQFEALTTINGALAQVWTKSHVRELHWSRWAVVLKQQQLLPLCQHKQEQRPTSCVYLLKV